MKFVLDIDKLLSDGKIDQEEYERLKRCSHKETSSLALNVLIGFGVIATAGGALSLLQSFGAAIVLGIVLSIVGSLLAMNKSEEWGLLGSILSLVGALTAASSIIGITQGSVFGFLLVTFFYALMAILAKSSLLSVLSALALSASVGAMTGYGHAMYVLVIQQPTVTIALFSVLALISYQISKRVAPDYERVLIAFSRTSVFLVNFGFWVGSLWGDSLWQQRDSWSLRSSALIPDLVFVIGWALALIITTLWAVRENKRWVVNVLTVFGAIHFYTQFFERLGASPGTVMFAGVCAILIAIGIVKYNKEFKPVLELDVADGSH